MFLASFRAFPRICTTLLFCLITASRKVFITRSFLSQKKAFGFFKKAANKGQKDGCIRYADHLISGEAEEQNEIAAVRYGTNRLVKA